MTTSGLLSLSVLDADGETGSLDMQLLNTTNLLADILSFIAALAPKIDLITDGQITKLRLSVDVPLPGGLKATPSAGAELERTGLYSFIAAGTKYTHAIDVPGAAAVYFSANQILSGNANVAAFVTALTTISNGTHVTDKYGNALVSLRRGTKTFRKHRRALARA